MTNNIISLQLMQYMAGTSFMFLLCLCVHFLRNKTDNRLHRITGWILLVWVMQSLKDIILIWYPTVKYEYLHHIFVLIDMTAVPTCAFLLFELTHPGSMHLRRALLHEVPYALFLLTYIFRPSDLVYESAIAYAVIYGLSVMTYILFEIPAYHRRLKQNYSYSKNISLHWLYVILLFFVFFLAAWSLSSLYYSKLNDTLYYLFICINWSLISFFINRQEKVISSLVNAPLVTDVSLPQNGNCKYLSEEQLHQIVVEERLFLNPRLTIIDLAKALGTNRTYISKYLNSVLNTTFFDYINQYRLTYAEQLLQQTKTPIEEISTLSGFNSHSTFRRSFTKRYGCTPSQYRLQFQQE